MEAVQQFAFESLVILVKIFAFVYQAFTRECSALDLVVAWVVLIFAFVLIYGFLLEVMLLCLTYIPALSANPPFYPSSSGHLVRFATHDMATGFAWQYPYLVVDGAKYNIRRASFYRGKKQTAVLATGTVIEFIAR